MEIEAPLGEIGHRRPYVVSTVHSSRVRSAEDREQLRRLTSDMDRLIAFYERIFDAQVQSVAARYFGDDQLSVGILRPLPPDPI